MKREDKLKYKTMNSKIQKEESYVIVNNFVAEALKYTGIHYSMKSADFDGSFEVTIRGSLRASVTVIAYLRVHHFNFKMVSMLHGEEFKAVGEKEFLQQCLAEILNDEFEEGEKRKRRCGVQY